MKVLRDGTLRPSAPPPIAESDATYLHSKVGGIPPSAWGAVLLLHKAEVGSRQLQALPHRLDFSYALHVHT